MKSLKSVNERPDNEETINCLPAKAHNFSRHARPLCYTPSRSHIILNANALALPKKTIISGRNICHCDVKTLRSGLNSQPDGRRRDKN